MSPFSWHIKPIICKKKIHESFILVAHQYYNWLYRQIISLLFLHPIATLKITEQNDIQKRHLFQNICFYETGKVAVSARAVSSDVRWRRILHEYFHVIRVVTSYHKHFIEFMSQIKNVYETYNSRSVWFTVLRKHHRRRINLVEERTSKDHRHIYYCWHLFNGSFSLDPVSQGSESSLVFSLGLFKCPDFSTRMNLNYSRALPATSKLKKV